MPRSPVRPDWKNHTIIGDWRSWPSATRTEHASHFSARCKLTPISCAPSRLSLNRRLNPSRHDKEKPLGIIRRTLSTPLYRQVTVSAAIVGGGFLLSKVLGLLREVAIARAFGTSGTLDAYYAAFNFPISSLR